MWYVIIFENLLELGHPNFLELRLVLIIHSEETFRVQFVLLWVLVDFLCDFVIVLVCLVRIIHELDLLENLESRDSYWLEFIDSNCVLGWLLIEYNAVVLAELSASIFRWALMEISRELIFNLFVINNHIHCYFVMLFCRMIYFSQNFINL